MPVQVLLTAAVASGAVCLDGSAPVYYIRAGTGTGSTKWLISHEGGGWCTSLADCAARAQTRLGSSAQEVGWDDSQGYYSSDRSRNPLMANWNVVFLRYCDGASFTGKRMDVVYVNGSPLFFRGRLILESIRQDLLTRGLADATEVVISGYSAGGVATFVHVDSWADFLRSSCKQTPSVVAMADSGFFPDLGSQYPAQMKWVFDQQNCGAGASTACLALYGPRGQGWKCLFAQYCAPLIQTPLFLVSSLYDSWSISFILGSQDPTLVASFGGAVKQLVSQSILTKGQNSAFLHSCRGHVLASTSWWTSLVANNTTPSDAFQKWYQSQLNSSAVSPGASVDMQPYPCGACCPSKAARDSIVSPLLLLLLCSLCARLF